LARSTTKQGIKSFDLLGFIDSARGNAAPDCAYEHSISEAIKTACPVATDRAGMALPTSQLLRDLQLTTGGSSGASLASVNHDPLQTLAGAARPVLVFDRAGIQSISVNDAQNAGLPRWRGSAGGWVLEGVPLAAPDLHMTTVNVSAKMCGAHISYSRRLRVSTAGDLQAAVLTEMQRQVRQALEDGFINGSGRDGEPLGLLGQATGAVSLAGGTPTWAELLQMIEALTAADGDLRNAVWLAHPTTAVAMLASVRVAGTAVSLVDVSDNGRWSIAGMPLITSTVIPEEKVILLDRRAVVPVYFGPPQLIVNPYSGSNSITGATTVVVSNYADIGITEPALVIVGG